MLEFGYVTNGLKISCALCFDLFDLLYQDLKLERHHFVSQGCELLVVERNHLCDSLMAETVAHRTRMAKQLLEEEIVPLMPSGGHFKFGRCCCPFFIRTQPVTKAVDDIDHVEPCFTANCNRG